jgi:hypothetical protein
MRNHVQTHAFVLLSWVNCALTGSHQIITPVQPPPPLAATRCPVVHAQPRDGMAHRDSSPSPSIPTAPTAVQLSAVLCPLSAVARGIRKPAV